jgi:RNA polymerase sigma factor (sigma-70 family)
MPTPWSDASDRDLLMALKEGEDAALDELIRRKTKVLLQLAQSILGDVEEARDVVQVTFFKVWENRRKFDAKWSPNTWMFRITSNLAIDHLRSRNSRERINEPVRLHLLHTADSEAHYDFSAMEQHEVGRIFQRLADALPERQRVVFVLREIEGLETHEVAQILGIKESAVRSQLYNARQVLRQELVRRFPEYAATMQPALADKEDA